MATISSHRYDDVWNVTYRRIALHNTRAGPRIKGRRQGNATVSGIVFENITLDGVGVGIDVDMNYETPGATNNNTGCTAANICFAGAYLSPWQPAPSHRSGHD